MTWRCSYTSVTRVVSTLRYADISRYGGAKPAVHNVLDLWIVTSKQEDGTVVVDDDQLEQRKSQRNLSTELR